MKNPLIAKTIAEQMGGFGCLKCMVGAYNFIDCGAGVSFRFKGSKIANYIKVTLTPLDEYDVEIGKVFGTKYTIKKECKGIYFDQLKPVFESTTKLYLSL